MGLEFRRPHVIKSRADDKTSHMTAVVPSPPFLYLSQTSGVIHDLRRLGLDCSIRARMIKSCTLVFVISSPADHFFII